MRSPNLNTLAYQPAQVPTDPADLPRYLREEYDRIAAALQLISEERDMRFSAPQKPRMGQQVLADGVMWDPGSGRGRYWYDADSAVWNFMG